MNSIEVALAQWPAREVDRLLQGIAIQPPHFGDRFIELSNATLPVPVNASVQFGDQLEQEPIRAFALGLDGSTDALVDVIRRWRSRGCAAVVGLVD
jgi:hypothetical protein